MRSSIRSFCDVIKRIYFHPRAAFQALKFLPAPQAGLIAIIGRGMLISLFTYLPMVLMGREPQIASSISFIPTAQYYKFLTWFSPVIFLFEWALFGSLFYMVLRLFHQPADFDMILNIGGVIDLAVQPVLIIIDWIIFFILPNFPAITEVSHWIVVMAWVTWLCGTGYHEGLGLPWWFGAAFSIISSALHFPLAYLFMRPI